VAPPWAGWRQRQNSLCSSSSAWAETLPTAAIFASGNKARSLSSTGRPRSTSPRVRRRLLKIPFAGSKGCHGKAFQIRMESGSSPDWKIVPQTMVAVGSPKPLVEDRPPDDGRGRLAEASGHDLGPAGSLGRQPGKNRTGLNAPVFLKPQENALRGHRDPRKMPALIAEGLADEAVANLSQPGAQEVRKLPSADLRRNGPDVVFAIDIRPGIKNLGLDRRLPQGRDEIRNISVAHDHSAFIQTQSPLAILSPTLTLAHRTGGRFLIFRMGTTLYGA
jgi:hypothetical protein